MNEGIPKPENEKRKVPKIEVVVGPQPEDELEDESDDESEPSERIWVDFDFGADVELGIKGGFQTYVISPVTEKDLFSDKYINCTGVAGIGRDKQTGRNVAFISHQDPEYFLNQTEEETDKFLGDLKAALKELLEQSEEGTIEVVIFGGNIDQDDPTSKKNDDYKRSIEILSKTVEDCIGQVPAVVREARSEAGAVDVKVLTQERKIFID